MVHCRTGCPFYLNCKKIYIYIYICLKAQLIKKDDFIIDSLVWCLMPYALLIQTTKRDLNTTNVLRALVPKHSTLMIIINAFRAEYQNDF